MDAPDFDEDDDLEVIPYTLPQSPKKSLSEPALKLAAAMISLVAVVLGLLNQHPGLSWFFVACAGLVLLMILGSWLKTKITNRIALSQDRKFIARKIVDVRRLFARFSIFVSENDTRSFRYNLRNAAGHQIEVIDQILGSDYITSWIQCYRNHLEMQPRSLIEFIKMCSEFTTIITEFNRNYVIKAQQGLGRATLPPQAPHWLDQLEKGREEFIHFLRDVEEWAHSMNQVAAKRIPDFYGRYIQTAPTQIFERVSSFRVKS